MTRLAAPPPIGGFRPLGRSAARTPIGPPPRRRIARPRPEPEVLTEEEERGFLGRTLDVVSFIGSSIDKPAAALRGTLGGFADIATGEEPDFGGGALNLIPFSDTLGITDPDDKVDEIEFFDATLGRLLGTEPNKKGFQGSDIPKFLFGAAFDPLLLVKGPTSPALKLAGETGQAAARAADIGFPAAKLALQEGLQQGLKGAVRGRTAAGVAEQIRTGERAVFGLSLTPFSKPIVTFGRGGRGAKVAAAAIDTAFYNPLSPLNYVRGALSPATGGTFFRGARQAGIEYAERAAKEDAVINGINALATEGKQLTESIATRTGYATNNDDVVQAEWLLRTLAETKGGLPDPADISRTLTGKFGLTDPDELARLGRESHEFLGSMLDSMNSVQAEALALGADGSQLNDDFVGWFFRRLRSSVKDVKTADKMTRGERAQWVGQMHRSFRDVPGGTTFINDVASDGVLWGLKEAGEAAEAVGSRFRTGDLVKTPERAIVGTVSSAGPDTARVTFVEPGVGVIKEDIPLDQLDLIRPGPQDARNLSQLEHVGLKKQKEGLRTALTRANIPLKSNDLRDLQTQYIQHVKTKPQLDAALADGLIDDATFESHWRGFTESDEVRLNIGGELDSTGKLVGGEVTTVTRADAEAEGFLSAATRPDDVHLLRGRGEKELNRAERLLDYFKDMPDDVRQLGFYETMTKSWGSYMTSTLDEISRLHSAHRQVALPGVVKMPGVADATSLSLTKAWEDAGFARQGLVKLVQDRFPQQLADFKTQTKSQDAVRDFIAGLTVDSRLPKSLQTLNEIGKKGTQNWFVSMLERLKATFQTALFLPFPASHARNRLGGMVNSINDGLVSPVTLFSADRQVGKYLRDLRHNPSAARLSVLDVVDLDDLGLGTSRLLDVSGEAARGVMRVPRGGPLEDLFAPLTARGRDRFRPFAGVRGGFGAREGVEFAPNIVTELGERVFGRVEFFNRVGYAQALHNKGFSPSEIIEAVRRTQFDYSSQSQFHKTVLNKAVLFPTFPIKNVPYQLGKLAEEPGGLLAQQIRAFRGVQSGAGEGEEGFIPGFLREQGAVPAPFGERRFITGGLPLFDLTQRLAVKPRVDEDSTFLERLGALQPIDVRRTAEKLGSSLNPIFRAPIEEFADRDLRTGRPRQELAPFLGSRTATRLVHLLPISRGFSEARRISRAFTGQENWTETAINEMLTQTTGVRTTKRPDIQLDRLRDIERAAQAELEDEPLVRQGGFFFPSPRLKDEDPDEFERLTLKVKQLNKAKALSRQLREERK